MGGGAPGARANLDNMEGGLGGFFQNLVMGGAGAGSFGGQRLNPNDFGVGVTIRDILSQLHRQSGESGPPPASKKVVEGLKEVEFTGAEEESTCAVCKDKFKEGDKVIQFPCPNKHLYHGACIQPWLKLHNSCPVCRFELATDDELYERMKQIRENMIPANNTNNNNNPPPSVPSG